MVRMQLPVKLCWALNMRKSQGRILSKKVIDLGDRKGCAGLTFGCFGRTKRIAGLTVQPMPFDMLSALGSLQQVLARVEEEVRIRDLVRKMRIRYT